MSEELNNNNTNPPNIILNEVVEILNLLDTLITVELPPDSNVLPNVESIIEPTPVEQYPELPPSPPNTDTNPDPDQVPIEKTIEEKEKELIIILNQNSYSYDVPDNREMIPKIYDLIINNIIDKECDDSDYITYLGFYYGLYFKEEKQKRCYKKAAKMGNVHAMYNL
jgi:hypothetical protein